MSGEIVLDWAMFKAAAETAAERAAIVEYKRQFEHAFPGAGILVEAPDRLIIVGEFDPPHIPPVGGRLVVWR